MPYKIIITMLAALNLFACSSENLKQKEQIPIKKNTPEVQIKSELPGWVENPDKFYPRDQYLVGLGVSTEKQVAENEGFNSIAKVFGAVVKVDEQIERKAREIESNTESSIEKSLNLIKQTNISTNQKLVNTKVVETYFDQEEKKFYVLVAMEKSTTADMCNTQISDNASSIKTWLTEFEKSTDNLDKVKILNKSSIILSINEQLKNVLQVLEKMHSDLDLGISKNDLEIKKLNLYKNFTIALNLEKSFPKKISDAIGKQLNSKGFATAKSKDKAKLMLTLDYKASQAEYPNNPAKFINWELSVTFSYNDADIAVYQKNGRTGQVSFEQAQQKTEVQLLKIIAEEFPTFLENDLFKL
jgi:hypothetical protein